MNVSFSTIMCTLMRIANYILQQGPFGCWMAFSGEGGGGSYPSYYKNNKLDNLLNDCVLMYLFLFELAVLHVTSK